MSPGSYKLISPRLPYSSVSCIFLPPGLAVEVVPGDRRFKQPTRVGTREPSEVAHRLPQVQRSHLRRAGKQPRSPALQQQGGGGLFFDARVPRLFADNY